jgi:hypothetical protein
MVAAPDIPFLGNHGPIMTSPTNSGCFEGRDLLLVDMSWLKNKNSCKSPGP